MPAGRFKAFGLPSAFTESAEHRKLTEEKKPKNEIIQNSSDGGLDGPVGRGVRTGRSRG